MKLALEMLSESVAYLSAFVGGMAVEEGLDGRIPGDTTLDTVGKRSGTSDGGIVPRRG